VERLPVTKSLETLCHELEQYMNEEIRVNIRFEGSKANHLSRSERRNGTSVGPSRTVFVAERKAFVPKWDAWSFRVGEAVLP